MKACGGNLGNTYIIYCLKKLLGTNKNIEGITNLNIIDDEEIEKYINIINRSFTDVIFNLTDIIRPVEWEIGNNVYYGKLIKLIKEIKCRIHCVGIGANSKSENDLTIYKRLNPRLLQFLYLLANKVKYIGCRGHCTSNIFKLLGIDNVRPVGCPSFFENKLSQREIIKQDTIARNKILYTNVYRIMNISDNPVILQAENRIIDALMGNPKDFYENEGKIFNFCQGLIKNQFNFFTNINDWKKYISSYSFAIGSRVHGAILAINNGLPSCVINGDMRSFEMCELLGIPRFPSLVNYPATEIYKLCNYQKYNLLYEYNYKKFNEYLIDDELI